MIINLKRKIVRCIQLSHHKSEMILKQMGPLNLIKHVEKALINIMSQQNKQFAPSLIASLYAAWEQHKIPAIFYHYTLAILSKKTKKEQVAIMHREIKQLKTGNHTYQKILDFLEARERSLQIIKRNVHILMQNQSAISLNWSNAEQQVESDGYSLIYQSRSMERKDNRRLIELINHIRMYQKVTHQVIVSIYNWQAQLTSEGYEGPIQFLHKHEDYLQKILKDTNEITQNYPSLFQNNPFLILNREHQFSQFAIVYQNLKFGPDFAAKIAEALQIVSNHDTAIQRHRILGKYKQLGSRKKIIKSESLHKIYCNYNNNKDYLIIKDPYLYSDRLTIDPNHNFKFLNNRNILINPEVTPPRYIEKRHPIYIQNQVDRQQKVKTEQVPISRSSSLNDFQVRVINHKESLLLTTKLDPNQNMGKSMHKKLSLYQGLDKTIKYKPETLSQSLKFMKKKITNPKQQQITDNLQKMIAETPQNIIEQQPIESELKFTYQSGISSFQLLKYLRDDAFRGKQMALKDIQIIAKRIISEKEYVTFVKVTAGDHIAAWMVIKFLTKELSIRKAVEIIFSYKFFKIPNFQQQLVEQFLRKGYGIIRQNGKIVHEMQIHEKLSHQAIKIKYKVSSSVDESDLKSVIKKNQCLKESRLLKYYYYSKQSKYHKYCDHSDSCCQIAYEFEQAFKMKISESNYLRLRCDKITKMGSCYRVWHHLNNTDLLIGSEPEDIFEISSRSTIELNSSFQDENEEKWQYLCLPELKIMHKYAGLTEKPMIVEYLTINGDLPEVLSVTTDKKTLSKKYLIMQKPFVIAIMCNNKEDFGKILSILMFN